VRRERLKVERDGGGRERRHRKFLKLKPRNSEIEILRLNSEIATMQYWNFLTLKLCQIEFLKLKEV
jgi:hypothetical protein